MTAALISGADAKEEMVERVAKEIFYSQRASTARSKDTWELSNDTQRNGYRSDALAAIAAMREPTEAMVLAPTMGRLSVDFSPTFVWHDMIDAALKEGK